MKLLFAITEQITMEEFVMQGDTWACRRILKQIDDIIEMTKACYKAQQINLCKNVKTANKYVQFGPNDCKSMLVGSIKQKHADSSTITKKILLITS